MSTLSELGYLALLIGTLLEGETIVFLAGIAAHHGYLWFPAVIVISVIGGFISDQVLFLVGRRWGKQFIGRFPGVAAKMPRAEAVIKRWDVLAILLLRFLWGLRIAVPIVIGACGIAPWRLAVFDFIGAVIWALVLAGLGYFVGEALQLWVHRLDLSVVLFLMAIVLVGGTAWNVIRARRVR